MARRGSWDVTGTWYEWFDVDANVLGWWDKELVPGPPATVVAGYLPKLAVDAATPSWIQSGVLVGALVLGALPVATGELPPGPSTQSGVVPGAIQVGAVPRIGELPSPTWTQPGVIAPPEDTGTLVVSVLPLVLEPPQPTVVSYGVLPASPVVSTVFLEPELLPPAPDLIVGVALAVVAVLPTKVRLDESRPYTPTMVSGAPMPSVVSVLTSEEIRIPPRSWLSVGEYPAEGETGPVVTGVLPYLGTLPPPSWLTPGEVPAEGETGPVVVSFLVRSIEPPFTAVVIPGALPYLTPSFAIGPGGGYTPPWREDYSADFEQQKPPWRAVDYPEWNLPHWPEEEAPVEAPAILEIPEEEPDENAQWARLRMAELMAQMAGEQRRTAEARAYQSENERALQTALAVYASETRRIQESRERDAGARRNVVVLGLSVAGGATAAILLKSTPWGVFVGIGVGGLIYLAGRSPAPPPPSPVFQPPQLPPRPPPPAAPAYVPPPQRPLLPPPSQSPWVWWRKRK